MAIAPPKDLQPGEKWKCSVQIRTHTRGSEKTVTKTFTYTITHKRTGAQRQHVETTVDKETIPGTARPSTAQPAPAPAPAPAARQRGAPPRRAPPKRIDTRFGEEIVRWVSRQQGNNVRSSATPSGMQGQCWDLGAMALQAVGAREPRAYQFGDPVALDSLAPGDILHFNRWCDPPIPLIRLALSRLCWRVQCV